MKSELMRLHTGSDLVHDITSDVQRFIAGMGDGLCHIFVPHATAGVALMETGSGSETDLAQAIDRLLPKDAAYRHRHGSPAHGRDHVLPAFVSPSLSVPVVGGSLALGTWQSIVVVDTNVDNPDRSVRLSFVPAA